MKKMLTACLVTALLGIPLVAQEDDGQQAQSQDPRAAMAAAMAAQGYIMPGQVTTPLGRITLHGMFAGGLMGYMKDNTAVDKTDQFDNDDEDWTLVPFDASWQANFARVSLTYENGNYGGYFEFSAEDWNGNPEKNFNTEFFVRHAFVWRSFFDSKLKLSLGKLYGENYQTRERIWKTEGATNGGWDFTENNFKYNMSFRLEYKPIDGLNVGLQWDFLPQGQSLNAMAGPNMFESLKEIAIAGEYKTDLFNVVGGVRFDGADGMNKFDFYGYLNDRMCLSLTGK